VWILDTSPDNTLDIFVRILKPLFCFKTSSHFLLTSVPFVPLTSHMKLRAVSINLIESACKTFWLSKDVMVVGKNP